MDAHMAQAQTSLEGLDTFFERPTGQFVADALLTAIPAFVAIWVAWTGVKTFRQKVAADEATETWRQRDQWLANMRWAIGQTQQEGLTHQRFGWDYLAILVSEAERDESTLSSTSDGSFGRIAALIRKQIGSQELDVSQELEAKRLQLKVLDQSSGSEQSVDSPQDEQGRE